MSITINQFTTATTDHYGEAFGLIGLEPGTTAYQLKTSSSIFTIGFDGLDYVCQIDENEAGDVGGCIACYQGSTPQEALENACVEACSFKAMRENDNCEDAVNAMSYEAYAMLHDGTTPDSAEQVRQLDRMMNTAARIIMRTGSAYGIVWEPYRVCDDDAEPETAARIAAASLLDAYATAESISPADVTTEQHAAAYTVAAAEIIPEDDRPAGYTTATDDDRATVAAMVEAIAERTHAAEAIEDAREAWTGPDYYRIAYSDEGMDATNDGAIWYETAADLVRDLRSAYESATETHLPYAERIERPTYQRHELEAFLGDFLEEYDADSIEAEATEYDPATGRTVWTPEAVRDLWTICERHELYSYSPAEDEPEPDEIAQYMRRQSFGDYSRADAATREQMETAALEFAAQEQTRPSAWQEAGARQARERYEADEATARDLMNLQAAGAITAEDVASYYQRHGWTPRKHHRN